MTLLPFLSLLCPLEVLPEAEVKLYFRQTAFFRTRSSNGECTTSLHKLLQSLITFSARKLHLISRLITSNLKLPVTGFNCAFVSKSEKTHCCYLLPVSSHSFLKWNTSISLSLPSQDLYLTYKILVQAPELCLISWKHARSMLSPFLTNVLKPHVRDD